MEKTKKHKTKKPRYFWTSVWDYKTQKWKREKIPYSDYDESDYYDEVPSAKPREVIGYYSDGEPIYSSGEFSGGYGDYYTKPKTGGGTGWHKDGGGWSGGYSGKYRGSYYGGAYGGGYSGGYDYSYGKSGAGYYHYEPPLSVSYIEQLAAGLASQYAIEIESGDNWSTDIDARKIIFDPEMLQRASRTLIIACLLHEIGHITYTTPARKLKGVFFPKYQSAHNVINVFEDLRVDKLVEEEQAGADEIEKENKEAVKAHADYMITKAQEEQRTKRDFTEKVMNAARNYYALTTNKEREEWKKQNELFKEVIEKADKEGGMAYIEKKNAEFLAGTSLMEYCAMMSYSAAGIALQKGLSPRVYEYIDKTKHAIDKAKSAASTQAVLDMLDGEVFPIIEELLKDADKQEKAMQAFGKALRKFLEKMLEQHKEKEKSRSEATAAKTGAGGHEYGVGGFQTYKEVQDATRNDTRKLIDLMKKLRADETKIQFQTRQRTGKPNTRDLYKHRLNNDRLFKRKISVPERLRSFSFTILVDKSGSMGNTDRQKKQRQDYATMAAIMIYEMARFFRIPAELVSFDNAPTIFKKAAAFHTDATERAAIEEWNRAEGGNYIERAIAALQLPKQKEKNRFLFIFTDGGEHEPRKSGRYIVKWAKQNAVMPFFFMIGKHSADEMYIKPPFGVDIGGDIKKLPAAAFEVMRGVLSGEYNMGKLTA